MKLPAVLTSPEMRRRHLKHLAWAVGGVLLLWLMMWAALPPLLKWQIEKQASDTLGRRVSVERIELRPWSLEIFAHNLRIDAAQGGTPQLSIARIYADLELQSLLRLAPVVDALSIESPRIFLTHQGEGRYDIDDVIARLLAQPSSPEPARFSVFNIHINGGEIDYRDAPVDTTHKVRQFKLDIPFLSSIGARREVATTPHLSLELNGDPLKLDARTTPFAPGMPTELQLDFPRVHLAPYLAYWPKTLAVKPQNGSVLLKLRVGFDQQDGPRVKLAGSLHVDDFALTDQHDDTLLGWQQLAIELTESQPLERRLNLSQIALTAPTLELRRDRAGRLNLDTLLGETAPASSPTGSPEWQLAIANTRITSGTLGWHDAATTPAAQLTLQDLTFDGRQLTWPLAAPAPITASFALGDGRVNITAQAGKDAINTHVDVQGISLADARPYLRQFFTPAVAGTVSLSLDASLPPHTPQAWQLHASGIDIAAVSVGEPKAGVAGWRSLRVEDLKLVGERREAGIARITLTEPTASLTRDDKARWMFEDWLPPRPDTAPAPQSPPWSVNIGEARVVNGSANYQDDSTPRAVKLAIGGVNASLKNIAPFATRQAAMPLGVEFNLRQVRRRATTPGTLAWTGTLRLPTAKTSLAASGSVNVSDLPVHALTPYLADRLNLDLTRADLSLRSRLDLSLPPEGVSMKLGGDIAIEDLLATTLHPREDLLEWKSLNLRGVNVELAASALKKLSVDETALNDFFARVIISPEGRINLQDLVRSSSSTSATAASAAPDIRFGPIVLTNGRVQYTDQFIKPNYSASLTELTGRLGQFNNHSPEMAELTLRGRAEGSATLEVDGQMNPLATPLALDLKGRVRDLELPPLSPYSAKYAGYGIERGKLSMDVAYRIAPDGMLTASNQITLNQLTFGEKIDNPDAPNLPIKLAVGLLADRNGVIDINLPISGSINDPQFRLGPIIVRLIFNLIGKAITSPFALLGAAFGGGEELSQVAFAPGSATLSADSQQRLSTVATALQNRPSLKLTVIGQADLEFEKEGWRRAQLARMAAAEKRRLMSREGQAVPTEVSVSSAEYPALLKAVYRRADITKPRNLVGLPKDIPEAEMEALLLASIPVTPDAMRELALARGVAVRDFLAGKTGSNERLFLGAPITQRANESWTPRAELSLGMR